jgi:hypothetical protein
MGNRIVHGDYLTGMNNLDVESLLARIGHSKANKLRADSILLANQEDLNSQIARCLNSAFNLDGGSVVSAHGVNRNGSEHLEGSVTQIKGQGELRSFEPASHPS